MNDLNLLSVDFDFFFPRPPDVSREAFELYDWGHAESPIYIDGVWPLRAATFLRAGVALPQVNTDWEQFWSRFHFAPHARLFYAESHSRAIHPGVAHRIGQVWNYDAHHDMDYDQRKTPNPAWQEGRWHCDDWMVYYAYRIGLKNIHQRYPTHRPSAFVEEPPPYLPFDRAFDDGSQLDIRFHRVFVARSGAWVPPWCDQSFWSFLDRFPAKGGRTDLGMIERSFSMEEAESHARIIDGFMAKAAELDLRHAGS